MRECSLTPSDTLYRISSIRVLYTELVAPGLKGITMLVPIYRIRINAPLSIAEDKLIKNIYQRPFVFWQYAQHIFGNEYIKTFSEWSELYINSRYMNSPAKEEYALLFLETINGTPLDFIRLAIILNSRVIVTRRAG
jgi:hypothetical protein